MGQSEKYNLEIGNNPSGSIGLILSHIREGSSVLECGCATGYMTKHMKEKLHCNVSIVEIDRECVEKAKEYADDWYCGDLEEEKWFRYFDQVGCYDYILFSDVLEHLRKPLEALKKAERLLGYNGKVIISIPNICHNDIVIRMINNHWQYTNLGLLDNTHIHFWGVNDLAPFVGQAGLKISSYEAVVIPTQHTEQRLPWKIDENDELVKLLKANNKYGEVYQWVIVCEKGRDKHEE